jgi:hypothetical protein
MVLLRVVFTDGTVMNFGTSAGATSPWLVADADAMFSPYHSTGAWAGGDGMPQVRAHVCVRANASEFFVLASLVIKPSVHLPTRLPNFKSTRGFMHGHSNTHPRFWHTRTSTESCLHRHFLTPMGRPLFLAPAHEQENLNLSVYPLGWTVSGFDAARAGFLPAAAAPPFVLPLGNKPTRPVAVFERRAATVTRWSGDDAACEGCWVIDFGRELQGGVNLTFTGASSGQRVEVHEPVALLCSLDASPLNLLTLPYSCSLDASPCILLTLRKSLCELSPYLLDDWLTD